MSAFFYCRFENALNEQIPGVAVPYWASTLDSKMTYPTTSVVWSDSFFGNGAGIVQTGPYGDWVTQSGPLIRNIGDSGGYTFREEDVKKILSRTRTADILEPNALPANNLEFFHGRVHDFIDGQMAELATATQDPVFFAHHAYVDFIWEVFRMQQRKNGIDPQLDYPDVVNSTLHEASAPIGFGTYRNIDSYSNKFIDGIYTYAPVPSCTIEKPDCGSPYLKCEVNQNMAYCVSQDQSVIARVQQTHASPTSGSQGTMLSSGPITGSSSQGVMPGSGTHRMMGGMMDGSNIINNGIGVRMGTPNNMGQVSGGHMPSISGMNIHGSIHMASESSMGRHRVQSVMKRILSTATPPTGQVHWHTVSNNIMAPNMHNMGTPMQFIAGTNPQLIMNNMPNMGMSNVGNMTSPRPLPAKQQPLTSGMCPNIPITQGYQNKYSINGFADISQWVYIPVKIIYRRPPNYKKYTSYPIRDNVVSYTQDIYSSMGYARLKDRLSTHDLATYPTCANKQMSSGTVFVQSNGINYLGTYKEYAVVDQRQALSMATTYVAVKNPSFGHTDAMITAFDSCGRVCVPFCRVPGSPTGATKACSGAVRLNSQSPKMFGGNYGEAVLDTWSLSNGRHCPTLENNHVFMSFYCDYEEAWPFVGTEAPTPPVMVQPMPRPQITMPHPQMTMSHPQMTMPHPQMTMPRPQMNGVRLQPPTSALMSVVPVATRVIAVVSKY